MVNTSTFYGVERSEIHLKYVPQADFLKFSLPKTHCTLITNDGTEFTASLISKLEAKGNQVVVLNLLDIGNPIQKNGVSLSSNTDEAIRMAIEKVQADYGKIGNFIHLHPHFEFEGGNFKQHFDLEKELLKTVFLLAKHLHSNLNELGKKQRASFLTVTRMDGELGQGKRNNISVVGGGLTGLVKCLNLEWAPVFCRAVDVQPELTVDNITTQIINELHDPHTGIVEIGYSEKGRQTLVAKKVFTPENQKIKTTVNKNAVFLVSGGAKGVTASCVIEMAKAFKCKFILLGRSNFNYEIPSYAINENKESKLKKLIMNDMKDLGIVPSLDKVKSTYNSIVAKKEIQQTINDIEVLGAKAEYIQGDVTNLKSFKVALTDITKKFGTITGIIHGAGRLADKFIQDKTETDFGNVLSVKLDGLLSLFSAVSLNKLAHLFLFSSVAGFYGNFGQSDYAIANEILSKTAHLFKTNHPNTHVCAINWGAWDSGMVTGSLKEQFEAAGVSLVNSKGGTALMVNQFNTDYANQPQIIIGGTLPKGESHLNGLNTHIIKCIIKLEDNPFLLHHSIQGSPVLPVVNAIGWMAQSCEKLYPDFKVYEVKNTSLYKGIVFNGKQSDSYTIELKELEKSEKQIVFETIVKSEGAKLPIYHYKATVVLKPEKLIPDAPKYKQTLSGNYNATDGKIVYEDGSLFHGPSFQGINKIIDLDENGITIAIKAPEVSAKMQGQFPVMSVNTFFTDIQYQGILVWVQRFKNGMKSLPLQTDNVKLYKTPQFEQNLFVNINIVENSGFKIVANCTVYDEEGIVYMLTKGAAVTASEELEW